MEKVIINSIKLANSPLVFRVSSKISRGGCWDNSVIGNCRVNIRDDNKANYHSRYIGFRLKTAAVYGSSWDVGKKDASISSRFSYLPIYGYKPYNAVDFRLFYRTLLGGSGERAAHRVAYLDYASPHNHYYTIGFRLSYKKLRGGSWNDVPQICRFTNRGNTYPNFNQKVIGFRLAGRIHTGGFWNSTTNYCAVSKKVKGWANDHYELMGLRLLRSIDCGSNWGDDEHTCGTTRYNTKLNLRYHAGGQYSSVENYSRIAYNYKKSPHRNSLSGGIRLVSNELGLMFKRAAGGNFTHTEYPCFIANQAAFRPFLNGTNNGFRLTCEVMRGGCWTHVDKFCSAVYEISNHPNYRYSSNGFRLTYRCISGGGWANSVQFCLTSLKDKDSAYYKDSSDGFRLATNVVSLLTGGSYYLDEQASYANFKSNSEANVRYLTSGLRLAYKSALGGCMASYLIEVNDYSSYSPHYTNYANRGFRLNRVNMMYRVGSGGGISTTPYSCASHRLVYCSQYYRSNYSGIRLKWIMGGSLEYYDFTCRLGGKNNFFPNNNAAYKGLRLRVDTAVGENKSETATYCVPNKLLKTNPYHTLLYLGMGKLRAAGSSYKVDSSFTVITTWSLTTTNSSISLGLRFKVKGGCRSSYKEYSTITTKHASHAYLSADIRGLRLTRTTPSSRLGAVTGTSPRFHYASLSFRLSSVAGGSRATKRVFDPIIAYSDPGQGTSVIGFRLGKSVKGGCSYNRPEIGYLSAGCPPDNRQWLWGFKLSYRVTIGCSCDDASGIFKIKISRGPKQVSYRVGFRLSSRISTGGSYITNYKDCAADVTYYQPGNYSYVGDSFRLGSRVITGGSYGSVYKHCRIKSVYRRSTDRAYRVDSFRLSKRIVGPSYKTPGWALGIGLGYTNPSNGDKESGFRLYRLIAGTSYHSPLWRKGQGLGHDNPAIGDEGTGFRLVNRSRCGGTWYYGDYAVSKHYSHCFRPDSRGAVTVRLVSKETKISLLRCFSNGYYGAVKSQSAIGNSIIAPACSGNITGFRLSNNG